MGRCTVTRWAFVAGLLYFCGCTGPRTFSPFGWMHSSDATQASSTPDKTNPLKPADPATPDDGSKPADDSASADGKTTEKPGENGYKTAAVDPELRKLMVAELAPSRRTRGSGSSISGRSSIPRSSASWSRTTGCRGNGREPRSSRQIGLRRRRSGPRGQAPIWMRCLRPRLAVRRPPPIRPPRTRRPPPLPTRPARGAIQTTCPRSPRALRDRPRPAARQPTLPRQMPRRHPVHPLATRSTHRADRVNRLRRSQLFHRRRLRHETSRLRVMRSFPPPTREQCRRPHRHRRKRMPLRVFRPWMTGRRPRGRPPPRQPPRLPPQPRPPRLLSPRRPARRPAARPRRRRTDW